MNTLADERKRVAALLQQIIQGSLSPKEALNRWPEYGDPSIESAKHALEHFVEDDDIMSNDKQYYDNQVAQLERFIEKLAKGDPLDVQEIRWLTPRYIGLPGFLKKILNIIKK